MPAKRRQRVLLISAIGLMLVLATVFVLRALKENINLFYTPTQVMRGQAPKYRSFRVGGVVVPGSVRRAEQGVSVRFGLTDTAQTLVVHYEGALPDLFRPGQGVVVTGRLTDRGQFEATEVLAKHDENYMPPSARAALKKARTAASGGGA